MPDTAAKLLHQQLADIAQELYNQGAPTGEDYGPGHVSHRLWAIAQAIDGNYVSLVEPQDPELPTVAQCVRLGILMRGFKAHGARISFGGMGTPDDMLSFQLLDGLGKDVLTGGIEPNGQAHT